MSSPEPNATLAADERRVLLRVARQSIRHGLRAGRPLPVDPQDYSPALRRIGASFVTLEKHGELRGCIGHLKGVRPLVADVADNAYAAAFGDPRFPPVQASELDAIDIKISVLSVPEPVSFTDEQDLLAQLHPGTDGLILEAGTRRGTFLPSVWESLPEPADFLAHLKLKAGLSPGYWASDVRVSRYRTEAFGEEDLAEA